MKEKKVRVEGSNDLYRAQSGAIINTDKNGYEAYKKKRDASRKKEETISSLEEELTRTKNEIEELKSLINQILNK